MFENEPISPIEKLVIRARKTGPAGEVVPPPMRMVSFRVPLPLLASVSALATITAQSRNTTMIELLDAGVFAVTNRLDDPEQFAVLREQFIEQTIEGE